MSLNFNYAKCKDADQLVNPARPDEMHPITHFLIWNSMAIDVGSITEENVDEVWFRTKLRCLTDDVCGARYDNGPDEPDTKIHVTRDDIVRHVGLFTNVSTLTRQQWLKKMYCDKRSTEWVRLPYQEKSAMQMVADHCEKWKAQQEKVETAL